VAKRPKDFCSVKESRRICRSGWKPDKYEEYRKFKKEKGIDELVEVKK